MGYGPGSVTLDRPMAKPNYQFEKRQRELAKKKKKEEKKKRHKKLFKMLKMKRNEKNLKQLRENKIKSNP